MLDKYSLKIISPSMKWGAKQLARFNIKPYQVTLVGFLVGMIGVCLIAFNQYLVALIFIVLNRVADGLDGALARLSNEESAAGAFLDIVLDFIFYQAVVVGFAFASPDNVTVSLLLMLSFVGTGCSFLAFAIYAEKFNIKSIHFPQKGFHYMNGLAEGTETIAFFVLACIFPEYYIPLAFAFMVICIATTIIRIWFGYRTLEKI
jgi:phosphatidylglycerophosphate synthase